MSPAILYNFLAVCCDCSLVSDPTWREVGGVTCSVSQSIESTLTPSVLPSLLVVSTSSHGDVFCYLLFSYLTFCHEALAIQRV